MIFICTLLLKTFLLNLVYCVVHLGPSPSSVVTVTCVYCFFFTWTRLGMTKQRRLWDSSWKDFGKIEGQAHSVSVPKTDNDKISKHVFWKNKQKTKQMNKQTKKPIHVPNSFGEWQWMFHRSASSQWHFRSLPALIHSYFRGVAETWCNKDISGKYPCFQHSKIFPLYLSSSFRARGDQAWCMLTVPGKGRGSFVAGKSVLNRRWLS